MFEFFFSFSPFHFTMNHPTISSNLFIKNRQKLTAKLPEKALAIVHTQDVFPYKGDQHWRFVPQSDFFYLTGIEQPNSILLLGGEGHHVLKNPILFIEKPNAENAVWVGNSLSMDEATEISGIKDIRWIENFETELPLLLQFSACICHVGETSAEKWETLNDKNSRFFNYLRKKHPNKTFYSLRPLLNHLRVKKEPEETALMKEAVRITAFTAQALKKEVRAGMNEYEIEALMTYFFLKEGAFGHAFPPIIAGGRHAVTLHYDKNNAILQQGDLLLLDFGCEYAHYASDLSITFPISGTMTKRQEAVYQQVLNAHREIRCTVRKGETIESLNELAVKLLKNACLELDLLSSKELSENPLAYKKYYPHGVSHFIGLDTHDVGDRSLPLEENMILSCEPGLYIPEEGIGIRIETDLLLTTNGNEDLFGGMQE